MLQRLLLCSLLWLCTCASGQSPTRSWVILDVAEVTYGPGAEWQKVDLPHAWSREQPPWQGQAFYRLSFALPSSPAQDWALYIPRAGNRYALWLNGHRIGGTGELETPREDHVHFPHAFALPSDKLHPGNNHLLLELHGEKARLAGLGQLWLGPQAAVRDRLEQRALWHQGGALVTVGLTLVMAVIGIGFGLSMGSRVYGLFGLSALLWSLRSTSVLMTVPPLGAPWWNVLLDVLYGLSCLLLGSSVLKILRIPSPVWRWSGAVLLLSTATLPWLYGHSGAWIWRQIFLLCLMQAVVVCVVLVLRRWWARPGAETHLLGTAALLTLCLALYDNVMLVWLVQGYARFSLSRFSFVFILLAVSILLMHRVLRSLNTARRFRLRLQQRLEQTRQQLSRLHEERAREREQEAERAERMRLLSQLHDGVGAHLVAMRSLLNQAQVPTKELEHEVMQAGLALRDSLQTMQGTPGSWTAALASLRDTLETRLRHAHVALVWAVQGAPPLAPPSVHDYQHLRLLLSEAVTNVIKHAQASTVTLSTRTCQLPSQVVWHIELHDNGRGYPCTFVPGQGSRTLDYRACALGAQLQVQSDARGTQLTLSWPL